MPRYTSRIRCSACGAYLSSWEHAYSDGVCPRCGARNNSTFVEAKQEVGHWVGHLWWRRWVPKESTTAFVNVRLPERKQQA